MEGQHPINRATTRRAVLKSSAAAALALALAACGGAAPTPTPAKSAPSTGVSSPGGTAAVTTGSAIAGGSTPAVRGSAQAPGVSSTVVAGGGQPKMGGTLKLTQPFPISPLDFHVITPSMSTSILGVFDTLVSYNEKLEPQPRLAESWSWNADKTELTFKLRQGVVYHSGRAFTSDDVKFNIERVRDPKISSQMRGNGDSIVDMALPDQQTITLKFAKPNSAIFDLFDLMAIVDSATAADLAGAKQVIGTGPFKWQDYVPGNTLTLVRNDKYWEAGKPYLDKIELQITDDKQSMVTSIESGQRDVAWLPLPQDLNRVKGNAQLQTLLSSSGTQSYYIGANVKGEGLGDKRVRQAIDMAIDRKRITDTLMFGLVEPTALPWPKTSPADNPAIAQSVPFDLNKAQQLLQSAGQGSNLSLLLEVNNNDPLLAKIGQVVQSDLAKIGVKMDIQILEPTVLNQKLNGGAFKQLFSSPLGFANLSPVGLFVTAFPMRATGNASNFSSPAYTDLVNQMQTETDPAKLKSLYDQMDTLLLDEAFHMTVSMVPQGWILQKSVQGFSFDRTDRIYLRNVWINK
jgi:peptide/nickel transport system substrate-binding protein